MPDAETPLSRRRVLAGGLTLLCRPAATAEPRAPRFLLEWGRRGKGVGELDSPIGIAVDPAGRICVTDFKNQRLLRFTPEGGPAGGFPLPAPQPGGIAIAADGSIYVAHWNQHKVAVYSEEGRLLREWGTKGDGDGEFNLPGGLAFTREGAVLVADQGNSRIQKLTPDGRFLAKWGEHGAGPGQFGAGRGPGSRFAGPQFLAVDREENVYATEVATPRVQKFAPDGRHLLSFGNAGGGPGGFGGTAAPIGGPIALCCDREGHVWVSATNHRVQQFDRCGAFLQSLGKNGAAPGEFHYPHGLAVDRRGHLYVVDAQNCRIQKFALE